MSLSIRTSKALAATVAPAALALKVRLLFPFCSSFYSCVSSSSLSSVPENHYRELIFDTVEENHRAFCNCNWVSDQFRAVIAEPELFIRVLNSIRDKPIIALRFFKWVESQPDFKGSKFAFVVILEILVQNNLMRSAYWVMERVIGVNMDGFMDILVNGYVSPEVSVKLLDLFL